MLTDDPQIFDCGSCSVRDRLEGLTSENVRAWHLFHQLCTPFVMETQMAASVLARLTADESPEEFTETVQRLSLIYSEYFPGKRVEADDGA